MRNPVLGRFALPWPRIVAALLVLLGIGLWMFVARPLIILAALGAFGPGMLRELGLLRDQDEFQREAARRAGYHAYLIGGFAAVLIIASLEWQVREHPSAEWLLLVVVILWMTWVFSALIAYWGAQRMTATVLAIFGLFWAVFLIASAIGDRIWDHQAREVLQFSVLAVGLLGAFFLPLWAVWRWPRVIGGFLVAAAVLIYLLIFARMPGGPRESARWLTMVSLLVPLAACGIALLRAGAPEEEIAD